MVGPPLAGTNTTEAEGVSKVLGSAPNCPPHDPRFLIVLPQTRPTTKRARPQVLVDKHAVNCGFHKSSRSCDRSALSVPTRSLHRFAIVHAELGEFELAFEWLERCYDARDVHLIFLTMDPKWDPLRTELRFSNLLRRCGFAQARNASNADTEPIPPLAYREA